MKWRTAPDEDTEQLEKDDTAAPPLLRQQKGNKKLKVNHGLFLREEQAQAVIDNYRTQEFAMHSEMADVATLQRITPEPKDGGRFYQIAAWDDDTKWGFEQKAPPKEQQGRKRAISLSCQNYF